MYEKLLKIMSRVPELYEPGEPAFWNDDYISQSMLKAHLDPDLDAASRRHATIRESVAWIARTLGPAQGKALADLGCGPGLYAEGFRKAGFDVTGVDFSPRSIAYARESAQKQGLAIDYRLQNYLELSDEEKFDAVTLIYCDYGVLSPEDRRELLRRIYRALKPGGAFLVDVLTPRFLNSYQEGSEASYEPRGFWRPEPYLCITRRKLYPQTRNYLEQYVVVTADDCRAYHIWNEAFTPESLGEELTGAGFFWPSFYDDVCGRPLSGNSDTLCAIAIKQG